MKVLFGLVNYRTDDYALACLRSIDAARGAAHEVSAVVLDNSEKDAAEAGRFGARLDTLPFPVSLFVAPRNVGYFGNLGVLQEAVQDIGPDAVIYANPDVEFEPGFLDALAALADDPAGVLAPSILPMSGGRDLNPLYRERVKATRLRRLRAIFGNPLLARAYNTVGALKERYMPARVEGRAGEIIYAAHGSVLVFNDPSFFCALPAYPCFLFGEELFVAEEARARGVSIRYSPELRLHDVRHATLGSLGPVRFRRLVHDSLDFILRRYFDGQPQSN